MSHILIDGRFIGVGESMTRYTLEVLRGILSMDSKNEYTLLIRPVGEKMLGDYPEIISTPNLKVDILDILHYSLLEQTKLLQYLNKMNFDLVHFTQFNHPILYKRPFVVTVHDLTMVGYLHRSRLRGVAFNKVMKSAVFDSKKIITVSKESKKEIVEHYHIDPEKIEVIYNGIDHVAYNSQLATCNSKLRNFKEHYNIKGDYLLYTGAWKKHKNLKRLLEAYEQFISGCHLEPFDSTHGLSVVERLDSGSCPQLVLVGKIDDREPEVSAEINRINSKYSVVSRSPRRPGNLQNSGVDNNLAIQQFDNKKSNSQYEPIITTGFIEEGELPTAYAGALAYVIPSLNEGFGLPPLEAMACGTPVIASNVSCMPEILGDAAYYFDPYNVDDIVKAIKKIVSDKQTRTKLIKKGLDQAKKYSWDKTARKTLEVYNGLI